MPSRNRFAPRFDERLRQSRVARGLEQEHIPEAAYIEPRTTTRWSRELIHAFIDELSTFAQRSGGTPSIGTLAIDPGSITGRITPRPEPYAAVPVPPAPEPEPDRKEPKLTNQAREQETEQTLITVLQQGVADAIRLLDAIKVAFAANNVKIDSVTFTRDVWASTTNQIQRQTALVFRHGATPSYLSDTQTPLNRLDCYSHSTSLYMSSAVARHTAVLNAIDDLLKAKHRFKPAERNELLEPHSQFQITDFERFYAGVGDIFATDGVPSSPDPNIRLPHLNLHREYIYSAIDYPNMVTFGPTTPLWQVRERLRMHHSTYTALPDEVLALLPPDVIANQIPHVATKPGNAGMIAYTQSPVAGMLDRQQVIKPGRYIRQHNPNISDEQVKQAAAACVAASSAGFHHSKDADDFARVYINGPSSCMSYDETGKYFRHLMVDGQFFHPARVYAHPDNDLEIVWLEVAERIAARAVINTADKSYPRIYGSDSVRGAYTRLEEYLEGLGYRQRDCSLRGQKLLKVHPDKYPNAIICPYIDSANLGVEIHDDHLVAGGGYDANHETGCLCSYNTSDSDDDDYSWTCECCGDDQTDDDSQNSTNDYEYVCDNCISRHYTQVHDVNNDCTAYVNDCETFYNGRYTRHGHYTALWFDGSPDDYGYVELCRAYYNGDYVAPERDCVQDDDGDWIRREDVGEHNLFISEDDDIAYCIDDWAVLDGELVNRNTLDDDTERLLDSDDCYPMLPSYRTIEQEDAA